MVSSFKKSTFLIAEIAQAHEGSLGIAHSFIDALSDTGVDAIKFQTHIAIAESSDKEPFRIKFSYEDESRYDYWKRMEFTSEQWKGLKDHCETVNIEFMSSPFSLAAVDLLESVSVKRYKIGSGEVTNFLMLEKIGKTGKPIIISSGMSSWEELDQAVEFLKPFGNSITLLQCTTAYPTMPEEWGLNAMAKMSVRYNRAVGFSDHSGDIFAGLAAVTLGATVLEFHVAFDKRMFGPDAKASLTIEQTRQLVTGVRQIERALNFNDGEKRENESYAGLKVIFGKSLSVNRQVKKGEVFTFEMLESKKPLEEGIPAKDFRGIIGKKATRDLHANSFLKPGDVE